MLDPLDLLLCPGCGAAVEPQVIVADDEGPDGWWTETCPCGYDIATEVQVGSPPTLRRILAGADGPLAAYTRAVARALGVS